MRTKTNSAVKGMREEHSAKRLMWNVEDVQRIIKPYPIHKKVDAVLRKMEDDTWLPEGESAYEDEGEGNSDDSENEEGSEEELDEEKEEAADLAALAAVGDTEDVRSSGYDDVEDVRRCGELQIIGCATKADALAESQTPIGVLEAAMSSLKEVGAQGAVANMLNEIRNEKRRMRVNSREDHEVLLALARSRGQEIALERKRLLMLQEDKKRSQTAATLNAEAKAATALLKKRQREI